MDPLTITGLALGILGGIFTIVKTCWKILKFGLGPDNIDKREIIYENKYDCKDPLNPKAFLVVDKWNKCYIYPFDSKKECRLISRKTLFNNVIFNREGKVRGEGGIGFNTNICSKIGKRWFRNNPIPNNPIPNNPIPNNPIPNNPIPNNPIPNNPIPNNPIPNNPIPNETIPNETIPNETIPNETMVVTI
jgi:hypothetical protein